MNKLSRFVFVLIVLLVGWGILVRLILPSGPFMWDEAAHALKGLVIAEDIGHADWLSLLYDSYRQVYWPPVHSWFLGISFLFAGTTTVVARLVSLIAFVAGAFAIYEAALQTDRQIGALAGIIAGMLFLTSPGMISLAAQSMLEMLGLFFFILGILIFFAASRSELGWLGGVGLGLAVTLTYLTKSNYGILLAISLIIAILADAQFHLRQLANRFNIWLTITLVVVFVLWFAYPPKIVATWKAMANVPYGNVSTFNIDGLLFYPQSFVSQSGSIWLAVLYLATILFSFKYWRDPRIRLLLILISVQFLIGQVHHTKVSRHILPILPPVFLCTSFWFVQVTKHYTTKYEINNVLHWLPSAAIAVTLGYALSLFVTGFSPAEQIDKYKLTPFVAKLITESDSVFLLSSMDMTRPSPPLLDWQLITEYEVLNVYQSGATMNLDGDSKLAATVRQSDLPSPISKALLAVLERSNSPASLRTFYLGLTTEVAGDGTKLADSLAEKVAKNEIDRVILITSLNERARFPTVSFAVAFKRIGFSEVQSQSFSDGNTRVDVFDRLSD